VLLLCSESVQAGDPEDAARPAGKETPHDLAGEEVAPAVGQIGGNGDDREIADYRTQRRCHRGMLEAVDHLPVTRVVNLLELPRTAA
jgi:hypothetical protein